jgi:soluble lytic murein transglycosylase
MFYFCRILVWQLTVLLVLSPELAAQTSTEALFDRLCRNHREQSTAESKAKLETFCRRESKNPLSTLGYFLLGFEDLENREFQSAANFFAKASRAAGPIQDYVVYHWASALSELGDLSEVQEKLAEFALKFPNSPWIEKAQTLYWRTALGLKDAPAILKSVNGIFILEGNPEALFYQAQAYELMGDTANALAIYQRLHYHFPMHSDATVVAQRLSDLVASQFGSSFDVSKEWKTTRIEKLFLGRRYRDALRQLDILFQTNPEAANNPRFQLWRGISQFQTAEYLAAIQTLRTLRPAPQEVEAQAQFTIAECYRKLDNYPQFKQTVEEMQRSFVKSSWWEEALFSIGNYNLVRRNLEESISFYRTIIEHFPAGPRVADCHWRVSWYEYRQANYARALELFLEHLNRFDDSDHRSAALYWTGRSEEKLGQLAAATRAYQTVALRFPTSYYGQLARNHLLSLKGPAKVAYRGDFRLENALEKFHTPASPGNHLDLSAIRQDSLNDWPRVKALAQIWLFEMAARELLRPQIYGSSEVIEFQAARLFYMDKNFYETTRRLRRVFPNYLELSFESLPREIWEMFYPMNYQSIILREARKYSDIDPLLIMALIRQESAYNPKAVSAANAHGLMQLLPSTARRLARSMKLRRPSTARLHDPDLNIRLGTRYFSDLLIRFGGQEDKVLASYNAGEQRVDSWMSEGNYADSAEFVETIPFSETRNYVKIIYRNYAFYRWLYGSKKEWNDGIVE